MSGLFRQLPKVDAVLADPRVADLPHDVAVACVRAELDALRSGIREGGVTAIPDVPERVAAAVAQLLGGRLRPVINATGILVHTNLGRAPWAPEAVEAASRAAAWCNLEMDLASGKRGGRLDAIGSLMRHLVGAEGALVVNNCASAVLLALTALARDKEVVVSRSELVEIGGSFRVPDVITAGGARLREVGTTNRTRKADYAAAIRPDTAVLLRVHWSNFRIIGFTESTPVGELAELAADSELFVVEDQGSGSLSSVRQSLEDGVDVVLFSGDKLLGGPQAGYAVGKADAIRRLRKHPMYRALRVDKTILAACEATLALHASGEGTPLDALRTRSVEACGEVVETLRQKLGERGVVGVVEPSTSYVGGGALPQEALVSMRLSIALDDLDRVARELRLGDPAIVARVDDGRLCFDGRTLWPDQLDSVAARVASTVLRG